MLWLLLAITTLAAPPSTKLSGPEGTLRWDISEEGDTVSVRGSSPSWTVEHVAKADLSPISTVHTSPEDGRFEVRYTATGAEVIHAGTTTTFDTPDLWDADTLDVRLGANVAAERTQLAFSALDVAGGKVYSFDTAKVGEETCRGTPCTHVRVQLTGLLRYVGPTWHYWYGADGQLLRFEGPAGDFSR